MIFNKLIRPLILLLLVSSVNVMGQFGFGMDEELVTGKFFQSFDKMQPGGEFKVAVELDIKESWHINSDKPKDDYLIASLLEVKSDNNFELTSILYPDAKDIKFDFSDSPVSVFEGKIIVGGIIKVSKTAQLGTYNIPVVFNYQACNNQSCMPPMTVEDTLAIEIVDQNTQIIEQHSDIFSKLDLSYSSSNDKKADEGEDTLAKTLESSGLLLSLVLVFLGGLALNLTPCVYPLIPITIGYFGGQSEGSTSKLFMMGLFYLLGMALTYSVVGVVTALSGAVFGTLMQNPIVILAIVAVLVILSLSQFGVYEFKLPDSWAMKAGGARGGMFGAFFMGLTMGIVAAPCIGPFVLGLVTVVATKADVFYGFIMFFTLAVGLGFPYLLLAVFSGKIKNLPRAGFWMDAVKHIFGLLLLGMALYFAGPLIPKAINHYVLPVFMFGSGIFLLFFDKNANNIIGFRIFKIVFSLLLIAVAVYWVYPNEKLEPEWNTYTQEAYEASLNSNQKMIIDFYADWCIPCKELDGITFSDPKVIEVMSDFKNYKVDMTKTLDDNTEKIRKKFNIVGMPTVLIINSKGEEIKRLTGFVGPDEFLTLISSVK